MGSRAVGLVFPTNSGVGISQGKLSLHLVIGGIQFYSVWSRLILLNAQAGSGCVCMFDVSPLRVWRLLHCSVGVFPEITFFHLVGGSTLSCLDLKVLRS